MRDILLNSLSDGLVEVIIYGILEGKYVRTSDRVSDRIFFGGREELLEVFIWKYFKSNIVMDELI